MKKLIALALLANATLSTYAQGTVQDYKNAFGISRKYSWKMANGSVNVQRSYGDSDNQFFIYSTYTGDSTAWYRVDALTGEKTPTTNPELNPPPQQLGRRWG